LLSSHIIIAVDITSPHPAMNISPEQIKQEITALQTALTALTEDVEILDRDILDVVDGSSAATLQRCFIAVQRMMRRCVSDCKKLTANFQTLHSILLSSQERSELETLRRENQRLRRIVGSDNSQLAAVQEIVNDIPDQIIAVQQQVNDQIANALNSVQQQLTRIELDMKSVLNKAESLPSNPET
jgi:archaellum component FlaC